jgi:hypothetical protein
MPNTITPTVAYLKQYLDEVVTQKSTTSLLNKPNLGVLFRNSSSLYIKIPKVASGHLGNYIPHNRAGLSGTEPYSAYNGGNGVAGARDGYPSAGASLDWEEFKLQFLRGAQLSVDFADQATSGDVAFGYLVDQFVKQAVVPERDAVVFSEIAKHTATFKGNRIIEDVSVSDIYGKLIQAETFVRNKGYDGPLIYWISYPTYQYLLGSTELTKFLGVRDVKVGAVDLRISTLNGNYLIPVTDNRFFTDVKLLDDGFAPSATSKKINFLCVHPDAVSVYDFSEFSNIYGDDVIYQFKGQILNYLTYWGVLIPDNKRAGVYASISTVSAATDGRAALVDTEAGTTSGNSLLKEVIIDPASLMFDYVVVKDTAFTAGIGDTIALDGTIATTGKVITIGEEFTPTGTSVYFALTDINGKVVAKSAEITPIVKA